MDPLPGAGAYGAFLDVKAKQVGADGAVLVMEARKEHLNGFGVVHGGLIMTLLDMAMGAGVAHGIAPGESTASIQINTDFLNGGRPGLLEARASVDRRGRTLAFASGELWQEGVLVGRARGIWTIRPPKPR